MLIAAAVVPAPPLLVPDVATGAASELDDVRTAVGRALDVLEAASPDVLVCVGAADVTSRLPSGSRGTLRGFGVDVDVTLGVAYGGGEGLPPSMTVLAWLLANRAWTGTVEGRSVATDAEPSEALTLGRTLVADKRRVAMLIAGDGSAALTEKAPGYVVDGAAAWQQMVTQALATADVQALSTLTVQDGIRYVATGRAPWQVLAGAADGSAWRPRQLLSVAPYGVAYDVVVWERTAQ